MNVVTLRQGVDALRTAISKLNSERDSIASAPVDIDTIERRINVEIEAAKLDAPLYFEGLDEAAGGFNAQSFNQRAAGDALLGGRSTIFQLLAWFDPDGLRSMALASVRPGGLTIDQRGKRLADVDQSLLLALVDEELRLREIDAAAERHEPRRPDAPPAILLAPTSELQAFAKPSAKLGFLKKAS